MSGETKVRGPPPAGNRRKGAQLAATNPIIALQERDEYDGVKKFAGQEEGRRSLHRSHRQIHELQVRRCGKGDEITINHNSFVLFFYSGRFVRSGVYTTPCEGDEGLHSTSDEGTNYWVIPFLASYTPALEIHSNQYCVDYPELLGTRFW